MSSDPRAIIRTPAIALIILTVINVIVSLIMILGWIASYNDNVNKTFPDNAERVGYYLGVSIQFAGFVTNLVFAPVIIYGAIQMMSLKKYRYARAAAMLAIVPLTSVCCLMGVPVGIWTWSILGRPEVQNNFTD